MNEEVGRGLKRYGEILTIPLQHIETAEGLAEKALADVGITINHLRAINYMATINGSGTVMCIGDTQLLPGQAEFPAMLWACCQLMRSHPRMTSWKYFAAGELIGKYTLALRFPEIKKEVLDEAQRERSSKGGRAHHEDIRNAFKNDYRNDRNDAPNKKRARIVDALAKHYPEMVRTTLDDWAQEVDDMDGFIRKAGRPKRGQ